MTISRTGKETLPWDEQTDQAYITGICGACLALHLLQKYHYQLDIQHFLFRIIWIYMVLFICGSQIAYNRIYQHSLSVGKLAAHSDHLSCHPASHHLAGILRTWEVFPADNSKAPSLITFKAPLPRCHNIKTNQQFVKCACCWSSSTLLNLLHQVIGSLLLGL